MSGWFSLPNHPISSNKANRRTKRIIPTNWICSQTTLVAGERGSPTILTICDVPSVRNNYLIKSGFAKRLLCDSAIQFLWSFFCFLPLVSSFGSVVECIYSIRLSILNESRRTLCDRFMHSENVRSAFITHIKRAQLAVGWDDDDVDVFANRVIDLIKSGCFDRKRREYGCAFCVVVDGDEGNRSVLLSEWMYGRTADWYQLGWLGTCRLCAYWLCVVWCSLYALRFVRCRQN